MTDIESIADLIIYDIQDSLDYFGRCPKGKCGDYKYNRLMPLLTRIANKESLPNRPIAIAVLGQCYD